MEKMRALTRHLVERHLAASDQIDSWAEQVQLTLVWKPGPHGLHMADMRYSAMISLNHFMALPGRLFALVGSWLENHDSGRERLELSAPTFDIEQLDADIANVDITLEFVEPLHLVQQDDGEIEAFGERWAFVPFDLWVAERGEVHHE